MLRTDEKRSILQAATACLPAGEAHTSEEIARAVLAGLEAYDALCDEIVRTGMLSLVQEDAESERRAPSPPERVELYEDFVASLPPAYRADLLDALARQATAEVVDGPEGGRAYSLLPCGQMLSYHLTCVADEASDQVQRLRERAARGPDLDAAWEPGYNLATVARALDDCPPAAPRLRVFLSRSADGWALSTTTETVPVAQTQEVDRADTEAGRTWATLVCRVCGWEQIARDDAYLG